MPAWVLAGSEPCMSQLHCPGSKGGQEQAGLREQWHSQQLMQHLDHIKALLLLLGVPRQDTC